MPTNNKAVAFFKIDVLVEVDRAADIYEMQMQAEEKLKKHVVEGKGFFPFRLKLDMVEEGTTVEELVQKLTIYPSTSWEK